MTIRNIILKGDPIKKEHPAGGTIKPGHVVALASTNKVAVNGTASIDIPRAVALELGYEGSGVDDAYSANDTVLIGYFRPGQECALRLAAGASAIVIGDRLELSNDGTVKKLNLGIPFAQALEAVDNSAGGSEVLIKVQIM